MENLKNLCGQIPESLHKRVLEDITGWMKNKGSFGLPLWSMGVGIKSKSSERCQPTE